MPALTPQTTRRLFDFGVAIKGIDGVLQAIAGFLLLFDGARIEDMVYVWITHRGPFASQDLVAKALSHAAEFLSYDTRTFAAYFLIGHGAIKVFLAIQLLRERMWAFPVGIVVFGGFIAYQLHRYTFTHSPAILFFSALDVVVIVLIAREWRLRAQGMPPPGAASAARLSGSRNARP